MLLVYTTIRLENYWCVRVQFPAMVKGYKMLIGAKEVWALKTKLTNSNFLQCLGFKYHSCP